MRSDLIAHALAHEVREAVLVEEFAHLHRRVGRHHCCGMAWYPIRHGMHADLPVNVVDDAGEAAPRMRCGCPARLKAAGSDTALWSGGRAVGAAVGWAWLGLAV
jgi:hypothetical protein